MADCCEYDSDPSRSIKCREALASQEDSAPWSSFIVSPLRSTLPLTYGTSSSSSSSSSVLPLLPTAADRDVAPVG